MGNKVLVFGYFGMGNVGADIRLRVIIDDIKKANPEAEISVAGFKYNPIEKIKGIRYIYLHNVYTAVLEMVLFHLNKYDYIVNAEGIPFVDFCGKGFIDYFVSILLFSSILGKKTICYSFDIDHLTDLDNWLVKFVLERTDMLVTRTNKSYMVLKSLGLKHKIESGSDCSFIFKPKKEVPDLKNKKIGFCFKDFFCYPVKTKLFGKKEDCYHYPFYYEYKNSGKIKYKQFVEEMANLINYLISKGEKIQFIINELQMDEKITKDIYAKIKKKNSVELISRKKKSLDEMKSNFKNLKCLIASRYHAVLLSLEYNIPIFVLSTDERFHYILDEFWLREYYTDVFREPIDYKEIIDFVEENETIRKEFKQKLKKKYPQHVKKAGENYKYLGKFFEK